MPLKARASWRLISRTGRWPCWRGEAGIPRREAGVGGGGVFVFSLAGEEGGELFDFQIGEDATVAISARLPEFQKGVFCGFFPVFFPAEFGTSAADIGDPPASVKVGLRRTWHGMLLSAR